MSSHTVSPLRVRVRQIRVSPWIVITMGCWMLEHSSYKASWGKWKSTYTLVLPKACHINLTWILQLDTHIDPNTLQKLIPNAKKRFDNNTNKKWTCTWVENYTQRSHILHYYVTHPIALNSSGDSIIYMILVFALINIFHLEHWIGHTVHLSTLMDTLKTCSRNVYTILSLLQSENWQSVTQNTKSAWHNYEVLEWKRSVQPSFHHKW